MRRGFTLVEIMIVAGILTLLAAVSVPGLLRARLTANETATQKNLESVATALVSWHTAFANFTDGEGNPVTLNALGTADPPYLDGAIACPVPPCIRNGYQFEEITVYDPGQTYFVWARPTLVNISGFRTFCVTEDGVVRLDPEGNDIADHDACRNLGPIQ